MKLCLCVRNIKSPSADETEGRSQALHKSEGHIDLFNDLFVAQRTFSFANMDHHSTRFFILRYKCHLWVFLDPS